MKRHKLKNPSAEITMRVVETMLGQALTPPKYLRESRGRFCKKPKAKKEYCPWCKGKHYFITLDWPRCENCGGC